MLTNLALIGDPAVQSFSTEAQLILSMQSPLGHSCSEPQLRYASVYAGTHPAPSPNPCHAVFKVTWNSTGAYKQLILSQDLNPVQGRI